MKNHIRVSTLNARSIFKVSNNNTQKAFTKCLRSKTLNINILCLQEVSHIRSNHTSAHLTDEHNRIFQLIFPQSTILLSKHCATIILNPQLKAQNEFITKDERCIAAEIIDLESNSLMTVMNIYAPAQKNGRIIFFREILHLQLLFNKPKKLILLGDFNLHIHNHISQAEKPFYKWISTNLTNCFPFQNEEQPLPTFRTNEQSSIIVYIFCHPAGDICHKPQESRDTKTIVRPLYAFGCHIDAKPTNGPRDLAFQPQDFESKGIYPSITGDSKSILHTQ
jgi:exonuclease III